jgi:hypothetical protein
MAISYVGGQTGSAINGGTISLSLTSLSGGSGSTAQAGDIVIVSVGKGSNGASVPTLSSSGYTQISGLYANDDYDANLLTTYKIMGGTPDTTVEIAGSGNAGYGLTAIAHVFRGVHQSTPLDVTATTATGTNTGRPTPPAITPTTSGSLIVCIGANSAYDGTISSGLSNALSVTVDESYQSGIAGGTYSWTSGTYTPSQFAGSTASYFCWCATTVALRKSGEDFTITETATITETSTSTRTRLFSIAETTTTSETRTFSLGKIFAIVESISLSEVFTSAQTFIFSIAETVGVIEILARVKKRWDEMTKNSTTFTEKTKNSSSWTEGTKS